MKLKILAFAVALTLATNVSAQTLTTLHNFTGNDGASPAFGLTLSGNTLYGTTTWGGTGDSGTIFKVSTDGTGFTVLYKFSPQDPVSDTNSDGAEPSGLTLSGNTLYGTTAWSGTGDSGTVFKVNTDGTGFTVLHSFSAHDAWWVNSDGIPGDQSLVLSSNTLYGTGATGGNFYSNGTIFSVNTDGSEFRVLFSPSGSQVWGHPGGMILSGNALYVSAGGGSVLKINTDGSGLRRLAGFPNLDGPFYALILSGNILYGTTEGSGSDESTVFAVNTNGSGFETLHSFTNNEQGVSGLILAGDTLYGSTSGGGRSGGGTIFAIDTDGTHFRNLYSFTAFSGATRTNSGGFSPNGGPLVLSGNTLYGTAFYGGSSGNGTVFALSLTPSAPVIRTQPQSQTAQAGSNVAFSVVASGFPSPNYQWQFNGQNIAVQTAASLSLTNVQFANAGGYLVIVTNAYGSVTSAVAQLTVYTNLVVAQTNKPPPPPGKPTIPTDATHFKVFTNGGFATGIGLDSGKSTIVLTHGWKESSVNYTDWPQEMANFIKVELGSSTPNIVAWDWTAEAGEPLPAATLDTQGEGYALGENLTNALGAKYSQRIHFIGHSLGTLVNARAANFIHTNGFSWSNTQMTLLDEAEVAWGTVEDTWLTATSLLQDDSAPQQDWKHPLPDQCAWADNYITAVGMPHPQAVNVILTNMAPDYSNIHNLFDFGIAIKFTDLFQTEDTDYHNYPYIWYENTVNQINNPNDPPYLMGFVRSWEGGGYAARPSANTYYIESTICPPSFPSYSGYDPAYNLVQITPDQANQHLNARPQNLISQVGVNLVSSSANILANDNNQVQVQLLDGPAVSASSQITGPAYAFATLIKLFTTSLINGNGPIHPKGGSPTNSPAYVWLPVTVPSNALTMAFNFMLQGDGKQDSFQVALNSKNLMTVETVLIQTNVTMNSGMINVSQYAGQQAELFFGIAGGTSTNAIITISDIAFYVTLPPSLQIQLAGTNVVVSWPCSAAGYVLETTDKLRTTNSWTAVTNVPVIVNFQYTVTNQISGGSRFYRLAEIGTVAPVLKAQISGSSFVLSWPASAQNVTLQTTTNLTDANSWTTVTNVPAVLNQQNIVTNGMSDRMRFYRLKMQ
jgi:uncharacterized repeat protein (TIGR03803 family)